MKLKVQKRLAAQVLNCSPKRVWFDEDSLSDIKEAITKQDLKGLIVTGKIRLKPIKSISRGRIRENKIQKSRGMRKGAGSRKGGLRARTPKKHEWMTKVRVQREFLKMIRDKKLVPIKTYHELYLKSKGGFFRSKRHIKLYMEERNIFKNPEGTTAKHSQKEAKEPTKKQSKTPKKQAN